MTRPPKASEVLGKWLSEEADSELGRRRYCQRVLLAGVMSLLAVRAEDYFVKSELVVFDDTPNFNSYFDSYFTVLIAREVMWGPLWSCLRVGGVAVSGDKFKIKV